MEWSCWRCKLWSRFGLCIGIACVVAGVASFFWMIVDSNERLKAVDERAGRNFSLPVDPRDDLHFGAIEAVNAARGQFGDVFGVITSFFSLLTAAAATVSLWAVLREQQASERRHQVGSSDERFFR